MTLNQKKVKAHQKGQHPATLEGKPAVPPRKNPFIGASSHGQVGFTQRQRAQSQALGGRMVADTDMDSE